VEDEVASKVRIPAMSQRDAKELWLPCHRREVHDAPAVVEHDVRVRAELEEPFEARETSRGPQERGHAVHAPVGSFAANPFGLHDVHGNVWEWCHDWYDAYDTHENVDPTGPLAGRFRTIRGGGWLNGVAQNRAAQRVYFDPTFRYCLLSGFRVVLELEPGSAEP